MKRILSLLLVCIMLLSLFSCAEIPDEEIATQTAETATEDQKKEHPTFDFDPTGITITENPFPDLDLSGMTEAQKAVVVTAESFFLRGSRIQYEDTLFLNSKKLLYYRWAVQQRNLEEYTSQNLGFLQCAAFCYEVYRNALDLDLIYEDKVCYYTSRFDGNANHVLRETPASSGFSTFSEEQLEQKKQEFLSALQPGDLIVYRVKSNGHAMVYVGNDTIIHSGGSVYNWNEKQEVFEPQGTIRKDPVDKLLTKGDSRYLFNKQSYCIIRPIADFNIIAVPQKSLDRMGVMRGVLAEKIASHSAGQTVSPEEELRFTFSLQNMTKEKKAITLTDFLPPHTEFVSGDLMLENGCLKAKVELPANSKKELSYALKVNKSAPLGTLLQSEAFVCSIPTNCAPITVANTLSQKEQADILQAASDLEGEPFQGLELANAIYEKGLGKKAFETTDSAAILADLLRFYSDELENQTAVNDPNWPTSWRCLDPESDYAAMIAPNLYGGRYVGENSSSSPLTDLEWFQIQRCRYVSPNQLLIGDVIITSVSSNDLKASAYLFLGDCLLNLQENALIYTEPLLSRLVSDRYFVVLRPSMSG